VRLNNSSTQVYIALKPDEQIDETTGDLLFSSTAPTFRTDLLLSRDITSRTYSFYYPRTRPQSRPRCLVVSSTTARYEDWADLIGSIPRARRFTSPSNPTSKSTKPQAICCSAQRLLRFAPICC